MCVRAGAPTPSLYPVCMLMPHSALLFVRWHREDALEDLPSQTPTASKIPKGEVPPPPKAPAAPALQSASQRQTAPGRGGDGGAQGPPPDKSPQGTRVPDPQPSPPPPSGSDTGPTMPTADAGNQPEDELQGGAPGGEERELERLSIHPTMLKELYSRQ